MMRFKVSVVLAGFLFGYSIGTTLVLVLKKPPITRCVTVPPRVML